MTQLSKERLELLAAGQDGFNLRTATPEESMEMARRLLVVEGQEPVAWEVKGILCHTLDEANRYVGQPEPLYTAPPAPVVPDDRESFEKFYGNGTTPGLDRVPPWFQEMLKDAFWEVWKGSRAAMLAPVSAPDFDEWSRKCDLQIALCDPEFREKARYIWDEACRAAMPKGTVHVCHKCGGTGVADSGGVQPWGAEILIPCDCTVAAPVVDADDNFYSWFAREWHENYQQNQYTAAAKQMLGVMAESAWRAAKHNSMLQQSSGALQLPDGWKLVPVEPNLSMLTVLGFTGSFESMKQRYEAMLAAAPQEPTE